MILPAVLIASLLQAAGAASPIDPTARGRVVTNTLVIPSEIAPAVVPYMKCRLDSAGVQVMEGGQVHAPSVAKGADCSTARTKAAAEADRLLQGSTRKTSEERHAFVEQTLKAIEGNPLPGAE